MPAWVLMGILIIICIIIANAVWSIIQWSRNNYQQQIAVEARVVKVDDRNSGMFVRSGTRYLFNLNRENYIIFELLSNGNRKKLFVPVIENELIAQGDAGILILQGTRFISFKKQ